MNKVSHDIKEKNIVLKQNKDAQVFGLGDV
jgi:hypothetical protein